MAFFQDSNWQEVGLKLKLIDSPSGLQLQQGTEYHIRLGDLSLLSRAVPTVVYSAKFPWATVVRQRFIFTLEALPDSNPAYQSTLSLKVGFFVSQQNHFTCGRPAFLPPIPRLGNWFKIKRDCLLTLKNSSFSGIWFRLLCIHCSVTALKKTMKLVYLVFSCWMRTVVF